MAIDILCKRYFVFTCTSLSFDLWRTLSVKKTRPQLAGLSVKLVFENSEINTKMASLGAVVGKFYSEYTTRTPKKLKLIDAYLFYILLTGIVQFVYCCFVGTFPFNSFLSGFISTVSCFILAGELFGYILFICCLTNLSRMFCAGTCLEVGSSFSVMPIGR